MSDTAHKSSAAWYSHWFDSPYYHVLYKDRDFSEARFFIDNLIEHLSPQGNSSILDVACGKGRHAIQLNEKGFDVTGIDLSEENIKAASAHENKNLHFFRHDMLHPFKKGYFDYVLNLFTSFGYFEGKTKNAKAVSAMAENLKPDGVLVLDFMNVRKVRDELIEKEEKEIEGITFHIRRYIKNEQIIKEIRFSDEEEKYEFREKVRAIDHEEMLEFFREAGLEVIRTSGDYALGPFEEHRSDRLILIGKKVG